jgi:site-specific recombinase XerD
MNLTHSIVDYRRHLKRRNYSPNTVDNYLYSIKQFVIWLQIPIEKVTHQDMSAYIDYLLNRHRRPQTINSNLFRIRGFYDYLHYGKGLQIENPVRRGMGLRLPKPLPLYLRDEDVDKFFSVITKARDLAMFTIMLRCGLRVQEVADLTKDAIDMQTRRLVVRSGKGRKGRVTYLSDDAAEALQRYLQKRSPSRIKKVFLVEKGTHKGKPLSIRGIKKRMEYYAKKSGVKISCHRLRHTMATQLLNADTDLVVIQSLLGHSNITTTEKYGRIHSAKTKRDYFRAMNEITNRSPQTQEDEVKDKRFFTRYRRVQVSRNFEASAADA